MKKFIDKTNQYLLERYPILWNTRLVWMLLLALLFHTIFFVAGFLLLTDFDNLHKTGATDLFFENGTVFFNIIISILLLVIWLIYLFKNNAFKNYYPTSRLALFKHFMCYFIVFFSCSSFYLSYTSGVKAYVNITYPDTAYLNDVNTANKAAVFLSFNTENYSVNNKKYPTPFDTLYCEVNQNIIEEEKPYIAQLDNKYAFYTLKPVEVKKENDNENYRSSSYKRMYELKNGNKIYYYKDSVVDVKSLLPYGNKLSYYNFSGNFYTPYNYYNLDRTNTDTTDYENSLISNKYVYQLLQRNNPDEIEQILSSFTQLTTKYRVETNINSKQWLSLIYHPTNFEVVNFIRTEKPDSLENRYRDSARESTKSELYYKKHKTAFYIDQHQLENAFRNIWKIKNMQLIDIELFILLTIAYIATTLLFTFRVTNAKTLIFSIITGFILFIIIILVGVFLRLVFDLTGDPVGPILLCFTMVLILLTFILSTNSNIPKQISGICINLTITNIGTFLGSLLFLIFLIQDEKCDELRREYKYNSYPHCTTIMDYLGIYWLPVLLVIALLLQYFYTRVIRKWKALPEG